MSNVKKQFVKLYINCFGLFGGESTTLQIIHDLSEDIVAAMQSYLKAYRL